MIDELVGSGRGRLRLQLLLHGVSMCKLKGGPRVICSCLTPNVVLRSVVCVCVDRYVSGVILG